MCNFNKILIKYTLLSSLGVYLPFFGVRLFRRKIGLYNIKNSLMSTSRFEKALAQENKLRYSELIGKVTHKSPKFAKAQKWLKTSYDKGKIPKSTKSFSSKNKLRESKSNKVNKYNTLKSTMPGHTMTNITPKGNKNSLLKSNDSLKKKRQIRNSNIQKSSSGSGRYKLKSTIVDAKAKGLKMKNKPPLSISTTPSHTKGIFKAFKGSSSIGMASQSLTDRNKKKEVQSKPAIHSKHSTSTQPKQKYMSFIKKKNLEIEIPSEGQGIPPAPSTTTNKELNSKNLDIVKEDKNKALSTKNAQKITFEFEDPNNYPLQPASRIIIPNHETTK